MDKEEFSNKILSNVSRETFDNLLIYSELLKKWQKKINLVGSNTIKNLWDRHIIDSAQLYRYIESNDDRNIIDIGSGAGFPGLVLSIMGVKNINLVESDGRKCSFLREVIRKTNCPAIVLNDRIENIEINNVSFVLARALSSLDNLLCYACPFIDDKTVCLFLKGENINYEVLQAVDNWAFSLDKIPSITDINANILKITDIKTI